MVIDGVVPGRMQVVSPEPYRAQHVVLDLDALVVGPRVEYGFDTQAGARPGGTYQIDDGFVVHEGSATPVDADEREEAMLDLVPLARSRGIVAYRDRHSDLVGEALQSEFPRPKLVAVAPPTVSADQEFARVVVDAPAVQTPPAADALDRELGGVIADPHVHDRSVPRDVVGAVGYRFAATEMREVMDVDPHRLALGPPRSTGIAELPNQFLLLGVDRDHRIAGLDVCLHQTVDVAELLVPLRVLRALLCLHVRLQRVAQLTETAAHRHRIDPVATSGQLFGDRPRGLARPAKQAHRVTRRGFLHDPDDQVLHLRVGLLDPLATSPFVANPPHRGYQRPATTQFSDRFRNGRPGHSRDLRHVARATAPEIKGFVGHEPPCLCLVQGRKNLEPATLIRRKTCATGSRSRDHGTVAYPSAGKMSSLLSWARLALSVSRLAVPNANPLVRLIAHVLIRLLVLGPIPQTSKRRRL